MADPRIDRSSGLAPRCARCHALLAPTDRFCAVCGSTRRLTNPGSRKGRGIRLLATSAAVLLAVFAVVAWIYFNAPERHRAQAVAHVNARSPFTLTLTSGAPPTFYLGSANGAQVSADSGQTWQSVGKAAGQVAAASSTGATVYLANPGLVRGNGRSWQTISTDLPADSIRGLAVDPEDPNRLYALEAGHGFYRSDDGGVHWTRVGSAFPTDANDLTIGPGHIFYLSTSGHGVFASQDGQTWSNANGFVNGALPTPNVSAIAYDPRSGDTYVGPNGEHLSGALYAATDRGAFKSIDGGGSWSALSIQIPLAALAVDPSGSHLILAMGPNGAVYRSKDGGVSW